MPARLPGCPTRARLHTGRAVFTEAYALIPRGVMRDIVTSYLPHWKRHPRLGDRPADDRLFRDLLAVRGRGVSRRRQPATGAEPGRRGRAVRRRGPGHAHRRRQGPPAEAPAAMPSCRPAARGRWHNDGTVPDALPLGPQALRGRRGHRHTGRLRRQRAGRADHLDAGHRQHAGGPPASSTPPMCVTTCTSTSSRSSRARRSRSRKRTSWSTASTCSRARRCTGSTATGWRSRPATSCGCAPSARRPATPAALAASATCSTRTSTATPKLGSRTMTRTIVIEPLTRRRPTPPSAQVIEIEGAHHYPINAGMTERYHDLARRRARRRARPPAGVDRARPALRPAADAEDGRAPPARQPGLLPAGPAPVPLHRLPRRGRYCRVRRARSSPRPARASTWR